MNLAGQTALENQSHFAVPHFEYIMDTKLEYF